MLDYPWLNYLRELNIASIALRIALAMLVGGILGSERGRKNRPAGFRTFMLVSIGATLVVITNQYASVYFGVSDPVRMGAQVVSGIGFLGAGTIIVTGRNQVKGITTAAGLWTAACSGLAIGIGFYEGALIGGIAVYITVVFMQRLDDRLHTHTKVIGLYLEYNNEQPFSKFLEYARSQQFEVHDIQISKSNLVKDQYLSITLAAKNISKEKRTHQEMTETLTRAPGVMYIEELL